MCRLNFLKALISLLLGTKLVTFFRPKKEELATLIADVEIEPGPFSDLGNQWTTYNRAGPDLSIESLEKAVEAFEKQMRCWWGSIAAIRAKSLKPPTC